MNLLHLPTTTSTMDAAKALIQNGDVFTHMVMADEQTASRGRHNRPWLTFGAPYSLQVTYILRPAVGPHLPLLVALALQEALRPWTTNRNLALKWPNDTLLDGKKLAGILCENVGSRAGQGASLVGIGVNIFPPATVPETFQGSFLCPTEGPKPTPLALAESIGACLQPLVALYEEHGWSESLHTSYLRQCVTIGQTVRWKVPTSAGPDADHANLKELTGLVRGLTPSGHLEMVEEDGTVHVIHSGDIFDKR